MAYLYNRNPQSPPDEPHFSNFSTNPMSPPRNPNRMSGGMVTTTDVRGQLTRRFTTNALPTLSPLAQQRRLAAGDTQMANGAYSRLPPSERKIRHIEALLEQQRRIAAELEQVDDQTRQEVEQGLIHERAVTQMIAQSEPTTPPEYQDTFSTATSRPNRYSMNSVTSPFGAARRPSRSSVLLTSPPTSFARPYTATNGASLPSQSMPGSRRHSDDEEEDDFILSTYDTSALRAATKPNRNSMPVTGYSKRYTTDFSSAFGPLNTTSFLFDDDEQLSTVPNKTTKPSPPDTKTFLQVSHTADGFPKLVRRDENGDFISGSSAALDLALVQATKNEKQGTDRSTAARHRISLPPTALSSGGTIAPLNSILASANDNKSAANNRRSVEVKFTAETKRPALLTSPPRNMSNGILKTQSSYSTNDIPTLKSINGDGVGGVSITSPSSSSKKLSEATSPEHITGAASRVTSNSTTNERQSQDPPSSQESNVNIFTSPQSGLQGAAAPFGPLPDQAQSFVPPSMSPYAQQAYYNGYGMQMLNNGFSNMHLGGSYGAQPAWPSQPPAYQQGGYGGYQQYPPNGQVVSGAGRYSENNRSGALQRKTQYEESFHMAKVSDIVGQIYELCKDQHGCRFLQKKLEERNPDDIQLIFDEVKDHFTELMMDPFGNYLCQRLLEYANDEQRTVLVSIATPSMTSIALNQHGTRALQRMIEYVTTAEQRQLIINALDSDVVQLIQDLNGNHVIQKCLNHLSPEESQFIFDAVSGACVIVGTHRHGCCVLQRCVDHATGSQKGAMVDSIIKNAFALVQDPFGNYVVQYILDLAEPCFTEPLCQSFLGNVIYLSKQKFSSNVIEKCLRCASPESRRMLICEMLQQQELEKMLRDNYANYVVQTALDHAEDDLKAALFDNIRPILPAIRHTPHGRRLATKIMDYDGSNGYDLPPSIHAITNQGITSPSSTTVEPVMNIGTAGPYSQNNRANRMGMIGAPPAWGNGGFNHSAPAGGYGGPNDIAAPAPQRAHDYNFLNGGGQPYQNGFANQPFRQAPAYGHF